MSSIAAWKGVAIGGPYSASKFALEGMRFVNLPSSLGWHSGSDI